MKIFCIGTNKTGTTSLKSALANLNFKICPINPMFARETNLLILHFQKQYERFFNIVKNHDAFHDRPWNHLDFYKILDKKFPNSKFILTVRNSKNWVASYKKFAKIINLKKQWFYKLVSRKLYNHDDFLADEENMIQKFEFRNQQVIDYFQNKNNLLIMNIEKGHGYELLCPFLGKPTIMNKFPHDRKKI
jgi:hypothetical protein